MEPYLREACVETHPQARAAAAAGADRVELCAHLDRDGLTPEAALVAGVCRELAIPVRVMIRPRAGDFRVTPAECGVMAASIRRLAGLGIAGVVLGACTAQGDLDLETIKTLAGVAAPLPVTVHKAIDTCRDPVAEVGRLRDVAGVDGVLTSGGEARVLDGADRIRAMAAAAGPRLLVIACGGIRSADLPAIHARIGVRAYHGRRIVG